MKVRDAMIRDVELVDPDETVQFAAQLMADIDAAAIPVGRGRDPLGVLTERDLIIRVVARGADPAAVRIGEVMSSELVTCREDDLAADVVRLMGERQIRRMPVVDGEGGFIGVVRLVDLAAGSGGQVTALPRDAELRQAAGDKPGRAPARGNEAIGG